jgi:hypothetical protein
MLKTWPGAMPVALDRHADPAIASANSNPGSFPSLSTSGASPVASPLCSRARVAPAALAQPALPI